jgi:hypothetical protein
MNYLVIHDDVPYFWDNWDICHHTFDSNMQILNLEGNHLKFVEMGLDRI